MFIKKPEVAKSMETTEEAIQLLCETQKMVVKEVGGVEEELVISQFAES